jgi:hypothetical protein
MSTTPSVVAVWNRALQLLGASSVQSTEDSSKNAVSCRKCYEPIRDKLLEQHIWRWAIKLAVLAADADPPDFGKSRSFTLPDDFIQLAPDYEEDNFVNFRDFEFQNGRVYTNDAAPLRIRYVYRVENVARMSPSFRELLAYEMALAMCEELTQSNLKKARLVEDCKREWSNARRANSRMTRSQVPPEDTYITARR